MQGFYTATRTLLDSYQDACQEVQTIVQRASQRSTAIDHTFVWGASAAIRHWVKAVQPTMDCMEESLEEQAWLLQEAREAGKEATEDILALLPAEVSPYLTPMVPREDILSPGSGSHLCLHREGHRGCQCQTVSTGAPSHSTTTSWSLPGDLIPSYVLIPAGDGRDGDQPGNLTCSDCTQPVGKSAGAWWRV